MTIGNFNFSCCQKFHKRIEQNTRYWNSRQQAGKKANVIEFHQSNRWCCVSYLFSGWLICFGSQWCANLSITLMNITDRRKSRFREFFTNVFVAVALSTLHLTRYGCDTINSIRNRKEMYLNKCVEDKIFRVR